MRWLVYMHGHGDRILVETCKNNEEKPWLCHLFVVRSFMKLLFYITIVIIFPVFSAIFISLSLVSLIFDELHENNWRKALTFSFFCRKIVYEWDNDIDKSCGIFGRDHPIFKGWTIDYGTLFQTY